MAVSQTDIQVLIYKTEYYIINKDYKVLQDQEYGITFVNEKVANRLQLLRMLLKALKIQYNLDYTAEVASSLYYKIKDAIGLDLSTLPSINTNLVIYDVGSLSDGSVGVVFFATLAEVIADLPSDSDKVITVKVFNEYFDAFDFNVKIFKAVINITNGLVITHNLNTEQISVQFHTSTGPIFCEFIVVNSNNIQLVSNSIINNVNIVILG